MERKYPWDILLDGEPHTLRQVGQQSPLIAQGKGYSGPPDRFRSSVITTAHRRGLDVSTSVKGTEVTLTMLGPRRSPQVIARHLDEARKHLKKVFELTGNDQAGQLMLDVARLARDGIRL
jgi:hypothetical protein